MSTTAFSRFRRDRSDLTLDGAAEIFGVDRTTILRWEKGVVPVPTKRLDQIERITGIPRHELRPDIFGTAQPPETRASNSEAAA